MNEPLISIIIPCFNIEKYIPKTLESVFAQSYQNLEVIAVDDGSLDGTGAILDRYAETEPRLLVLHQENQGVSAARIHGANASHGEYIGFVDGDDLIDADMYERLLRNAETYHADISHCGYRMIFPEKTEYYYNSGVLSEQDRQSGLIDLLEGKIIEPALVNKLFARHLVLGLLDGGSLMDLSFRENEDLLMNYCLFSHAEKSVFEDFCPYQYVVRSDSSSHGGLKPHILNDPIRIGESLLTDTKAEPELYRLSGRYYITKLIKAATVSGKSISPDIQSIRKAARRKLRSFLGEYLSLKEESRKRKLLAICATYCPSLYGFVHRLYRYGS
ncbi:MAG: glycosyltransferase [Clostridia bacterium]|nr:glycosyltransferase [Clostridia bacterium]